ncbi:hypothetical protein [Tropicimonas isoalkanivorans]|uniref:Uncharacterized protein n=1 Tax=Tropicimonas isoalkanivorans TaxID=441112 RepID=A0A1I1L329_9RHOB|nr:hypothetical protein [Tropicimonas isoalkanivorans]SFC67391.1 hypothetical protein SAMN04488094_107199 [Tropicimonas isoalkanivorans]
MWSRLEDRRYYYPTLYAISGMLTLAIGLLWHFEAPLWEFYIFCILGVLLSIWVDELAPVLLRGLEQGPHEPAPTGMRAALIRLRLACFGAVSTIVFLGGALSYYGYDLGDRRFIASCAVIVLAGIPLSLVSKRATLWMLACWRSVEGLCCNAIDFCLALTLVGDSLRSAHQTLYDLENRLFVAIAGYQTSFTFRSAPRPLRDDIPNVDLTAQ